MRTAIKIMNSIKGIRIAGTKEADRAAVKIKKQFSNKHVKVCTESFSLMTSQTQLSAIKVGKLTVKGIPYGLTVPFSIQGKLLYTESIAELMNISSNIKGSIILSRERPKPQRYKALKKMGLKGIISASRYDNRISSLHLSDWMLRDKCIIPAINIAFDDALKLMKYDGKKITIKGKGKTFKGKTNNIVADIKGNEKTEETLLITGHYDSVPFSPGASDNSGGIGIMSELIEYFSKYPVKRNIRFIAFSGEEWGLWGSRYYCNRHAAELKHFIGGINLDVAGDVFGVNYCKVTGNKRLTDTIKNIADYDGCAINVSEDIYSSDNMPFAHNGIPFINIMRGGGKPSVYIHTEDDKMDMIDPASFDTLVDFCKSFIERAGNAQRNIIDRSIDEDIKKKIDNYFKMRGIKEDHITKKLPYAKRSGK